MNINFDSTYSGLYLFLSVIGASGVSVFLYFRNADVLNFSLFQKIFLAVIRFCVLLLIFLLLLSPLFEQSKTIKQKPVIAIAFDNSQSVVAFLPQLKSFYQASRERFSDDYQLDFWSFGEKVLNSASFSGTDRRSDYGQILKTLKNSYVNKNIGAVVLLGDGIYNQGQNPENLIAGLKFPVYTVGVGDTARKTDAIIRNVKTNKIAFLKNKFPVEIEIKFSRLKNKIAYLEVENNNKSVYAKTIAINSDDDFKLEFANLEASEPGIQHYKVKIRPFNGETNLVNNTSEFVIRVMENKQKILMLSDGPHPDLGAIRNSLNALQNYDIKLVTGNEAPDSLSLYSLIILNQLPSLKNPASKLLKRIKETHLPILFIIGPESMPDQLNSLDMGLQIDSDQKTEEVQANFNNNFGLFTLSDETKEIFKSAPPLLAPFGNTSASVLLQSLALQKIRNIPTNKTLLAFGNDKGRKVGFIVGEGLWRWRLYNFQETGNVEAFDELIHTLIQYLALKQNEDNFNVYYPAVYQETDHVALTAELYNDSYQLVNTPDATLHIIDSHKKEFNFQFDRKEDYYTLDAGLFESGDYSFIAETKLGSQSFTERGNFSVIKNEMETQSTQADYSLLNSVSLKTGGKFYPVDNFGTLLDSIKSNKQIKIQRYKQNVQSELINIKLVFILLVLLLGTEWFLRKYWGIY